MAVITPDTVYGMHSDKSNEYHCTEKVERLYVKRICADVQMFVTHKEIFSGFIVTHNVEATKPFSHSRFLLSVSDESKQSYYILNG
jgi:hypothetical protein